MSSPEDMQAFQPPARIGRKRWVALGSAVLYLASLVVVLADSSPEFWGMNPFMTAFMGIFGLIFLWPVYAVYLLVLTLVFRRKEVSLAVRRRWFLGLPLALLAGAALDLAYQDGPAGSLAWIVRDGEPVRTAHAVHTVHVSTLMMDRELAWFAIDPGELQMLIRRNQLMPTNGINLCNLLSEDMIMGRSTVAERIPVFRDPVYFRQAGLDEVGHYYEVIVLTNPARDAAVWYERYDR